MVSEDSCRIFLNTGEFASSWNCFQVLLPRIFNYISKFNPLPQPSKLERVFWSDIHYLPSSCLSIFWVCFLHCRKFSAAAAAAAAAAKSLQSCLTLCDPIDGSPPGSSNPGILQARTLEWVAISFSSAWKWKVKSEIAQSCPNLHDPMDCSPPGSSVHGFFQAGVLEWVAIAFSEGSSIGEFLFSYRNSIREKKSIL